MSVVRDVLKEWAERVDVRLLPNLYAAVSVPTEPVRQQLRRMRKPFLDPANESPPPSEVDRTAQWLITQSASRSTFVAGVAGLGGAASVPPETIATLIAAVRLAQRLTIVYGLDPETDSGQMALWRALAAGFQIEVPAQGPMALRIRDLPGLVGTRSADTAPGELARSLVQSSTWMIAGRISRLVPILSSGFSARAARRRVQEMGGRMAEVLRRIGDLPAAGEIEDVVEIP